MGVLSVLLASALGASVVSSEEAQWFPGDYFHSRARESLQRRVMTSWPGPTALVGLWRADELDEDDRVSLLLGAAAYRDPQLLPLYRRALASGSQRLRQAAAYGYRDLLADQLPDVRGGIDDRAVALLDEEMALVAWTLDRRSLLELWLQAALANEGSGLPGWEGITLTRPLGVCLKAVEAVAGMGDLELLVAAVEASGDIALRTNLLKLIEGLTLSRFLVMPGDRTTGWGPHVFDDALGELATAVRRWEAAGCRVDDAAVLRSNLAGLGVSGVEPLAAEGCLLWVGVLERGHPRWWMLASRRLYACGGPWLPLSAMDAQSPANTARRQELLDWHRPLVLGGGR